MNYTSRLLVSVFLHVSLYYYLVVCLKPLGTRVIQFLQDATILTSAVPSGATGRAATPFTGVTKDGAIINVEIGLAIVVVKAVATGAAVEADELVVGVAYGKLALVANAKGVGVGVVAFVRGGVVNVKDAGRGL